MKRIDIPALERQAHMAFGEVRHTRLRPARNAFRYPSYFLRLPVRHIDEALAQQRWLAHNHFNLLSFYDRDHGDQEPGTPTLPPLAWIEALLARERIDDADGAIWLHAFPRVLGYVFNPVSFWFCHRGDDALRAIVCEVRNTFGERHCYLLANDDGTALQSGVELQAQKTFHVSPFCKVEGRYRFRFLHNAKRTLTRIDYDDNDDGPLLLTSISGTLAPLDNRTVLRAFFGRPLFTFGVVTRIHWQALRLWLKRVRFIAKPERPDISLTRSSSTTITPTEAQS